MSPDTPSIRRLQAIVRGRVQGVGFRFFVLDEADRLGLQGYVRNRPWGDVEVVAEGPEPALGELQRLLHQGPPGAYVTGIDARLSEPAGAFARFEIRR